LRDTDRPIALFAQAPLLQAALNHVINILGLARKISAWTFLAVCRSRTLRLKTKPSEAAWPHVFEAMQGISSSSHRAVDSALRAGKKNSAQRGKKKEWSSITI